MTIRFGHMCVANCRSLVMRISDTRMGKTLVGASIKVAEGWYSSCVNGIHGLFLIYSFQSSDMIVM